MLKNEFSIPIILGRLRNFMFTMVFATPTLEFYIFSNFTSNHYKIYKNTLNCLNITSTKYVCQILKSSVFIKDLLGGPFFMPNPLHKIQYFWENE